MENFGRQRRQSSALFFNGNTFYSVYSAIRRCLRRVNVPSSLLILVLVQSATAVPIDGDMNPIMRYRLHAHFMERRMRYPTTNTLTKTLSSGHAGRNCFFSPIQCQLPVFQNVRQASPSPTSVPSQQAPMAFAHQQQQQSHERFLVSTRTRFRRMDSQEMVPVWARFTN